MQGKVENIERWPQICKEVGWDKYDNDLHVYPYVKAVPGVLSMGCPLKCFFCPTAKIWEGKTHYADYEKIIPQYAGMSVHWMDENFFTNPDLDRILELLRLHKVRWLAMSTNKETRKAFETFSEATLYNSGLRVVEMGLENVALMMKVKRPLTTKFVSIYYLNMTFMPGETKTTIRENGLWMESRSLKDPIHHNNGLWYAPGQFYYPYGEERTDGINLTPPEARTRPTYIPDSFLDQDYHISNLPEVNFYSQLVYGYKVYNPTTFGSIREFIGNDYKKAMWLAVGFRIGAIL